MRQTIAALPIKSFKNLLWLLAKLQRPSGASLSLRSLSHSLLLLQPSFGQLPVSFMPLHSFRPSLRFITPRSYLKYLLQGMAHIATHKAEHKWCTFLFASQATILTGFHSAALRPAFISVAFSPPAAYNFARLACLLRLRVCHGFEPTAQSLMMSKTHAKPLRFTVAVYRRFTAHYPAPCRHSQPPSFVPLFGVFVGSLRCYATVWTSVPHGYASFCRRRYYLFDAAKP